MTTWGCHPACQSQSKQRVRTEQKGQFLQELQCGVWSLIGWGKQGIDSKEGLTFYSKLEYSPVFKNAGVKGREITREKN